MKIRILWHRNSNKFRCVKKRFGEEKRFSSLRGDSGEARRIEGLRSARGAIVPMDKIATKLHILYVIENSFFGGGERAFAQVINGLDKEKARTMVLREED